ncbi:MAG: hypothetical protein DMF72_06425 [Acidobacteria bacterium]|nr:MAG: hypothetical protein DMF72_06425 [Acidobacteriota bacterium]
MSTVSIAQTSISNETSSATFVATAVNVELLESLVAFPPSHGGVLVSPRSGCAHGGVLVSPANVLTANIDTKARASANFLICFMVSLLNGISCKLFMRANNEPVGSKLWMAQYSRFNTSPSVATQGFYH